MFKRAALAVVFSASAAFGQATFTGYLAGIEQIDTFQVRSDQGVDLRLYAIDAFTPSVAIFYGDELLNARYGPGSLYALGPAGVYTLAVLTNDEPGHYRIEVAAPAVAVPEPTRAGFWSAVGFYSTCTSLLRRRRKEIAHAAS